MTNPLIQIGDPVSGEGSDTTRTAFAKYNSHTHAETFASFLQINVSPGDVIEGINFSTEIEQIFPASTVIEEVHSDHLKLSAPSLISSNSNAEFLINGITYKNLTVSNNSNEVTFSSSTGFLPPNLLNTSLSDFVHLRITNPTQYEKFNVLIQPGFSGVIQSICSISDINQCEIRVLVNDLTISPSHTASSTPNSTNFVYSNANNLMFLNTDVVSLEVFNVTGPLKLDLNLYFFKRSL